MRSVHIFVLSSYHNDLGILQWGNWRVRGQLIGQMTWRRFPHSQHDVTRNREHSVEKKANMTRIIFRSRKLRTNTQPNFFGVSTFNPINFFSFSISFVRTFAWKPHFIIKGGTCLLIHSFIVSTMSNTNGIQVGHDVSDFNRVKVQISY